MQRGAHCVCCLQRDQVWDWQQVRDNIDSQARLVVDARGAGRWAGTAPEPRPGIRGGHMPGSKNVPFDHVLSNGRWGLTMAADGYSRTTRVGYGMQAGSS